MQIKFLITHVKIMYNHWIHLLSWLIWPRCLQNNTYQFQNKSGKIIGVSCYKLFKSYFLIINNTHMFIYSSWFKLTYLYTIYSRYMNIKTYKQVYLFNSGFTGIKFYQFGHVSPTIFVYTSTIKGSSDVRRGTNTWWHL